MDQKEDDRTIVTARQVIRKRMEELWSESVSNTQTLGDIDAQIQELVAKKAQIMQRSAEISIETEILESYENGRQFKIVRVTEEITVTDRSGRKNSSDKLDFESSLVAIFSGNNKREMGGADLIAQLESLGWKWSKYEAAYAYISKSDILEKVSRGTFELRR
jgi:hypothetical protein